MRWCTPGCVCVCAHTQVHMCAVIYMLLIDPPSTLCLETLALTARHPCRPDSLGSQLLVRFCPWQAMAGLNGRGRRRAFLPACSSYSHGASSSGQLRAHPPAAPFLSVIPTCQLCYAPLGHQWQPRCAHGSQRAWPRSSPCPLGAPKSGPVPRAGDKPWVSPWMSWHQTHHVPFRGLNTTAPQSTLPRKGGLPGPSDAIMLLPRAHPWQRHCCF